MVVDALLFIFSGILGAFGGFLPHYHLWPTIFLNAITYLLSQLAILNFIFPVDAIFTGANFFIKFLVIYYGLQLVVSIFNYFRGSGGIKV